MIYMHDNPKMRYHRIFIDLGKSKTASLSKAVVNSPISIIYCGLLVYHLNEEYKFSIFDTSSLYGTAFVKSTPDDALWYEVDALEYSKNIDPSWFN